MRCIKPFRRFGCGQCMPCRIQHRRVWTHRLLLESQHHEHSTFITLTYDDENLPYNGSLVPEHTQLWLKRLRKELPPKTLRFFLVGEYGEHTSRPHYHAALFGLPLSPSHIQNYHSCSCSTCNLVRKTWGKGNILIGTLTVESARYIAGYVTKKMTSWHDPRLQGKHPEFTRQSNRSGIGAPAIPEIAEVFNTKYGAIELATVGDVPTSLTHGTKQMPLGRYLRKKLQKEVGIYATTQHEKDQLALRLSKQHAVQEAEKMQSLRQDYEKNTISKKITFEEYKKLTDKQKSLNMISTFNVYDKKGNL